MRARWRMGFDGGLWRDGGCRSKISEERMAAEGAPTLVKRSQRRMVVDGGLWRHGARVGSEGRDDGGWRVYELLDLGPQKKSREVFTIADASIESVVGIVEDVLVKIGQLTIPADFHVIMPTDTANLFTIRNNPTSASDQVVIHKSG
ncbi:hypothetical protein PIB30_078873 [Stylosanthes scabra]|uniref:Uncharacterized protein n=1 Tax=Stylosanthes scabra TaxID=79078 RepID=A0ABU6TQK8_9FABA|nr:hypothetical protein [Stylosanthes scabra]